MQTKGPAHARSTPGCRCHPPRSRCTPLSKSHTARHCPHELSERWSKMRAAAAPGRIGGPAGLLLLTHATSCCVTGGQSALSMHWADLCWCHSSSRCCRGMSKDHAGLAAESAGPPYQAVRHWHHCTECKRCCSQPQQCRIPIALSSCCRRHLLLMMLKVQGAGCLCIALPPLRCWCLSQCWLLAPHT